MNNTNTTTQSTEQLEDRSAAQSSTPQITTVEALVTEARRRGFQVTGGFQPRHLIPLVETALGRQKTKDHGLSETSGDFIEWKREMDNLQEFLALLKALPERLPYKSATQTATPGIATAPASFPSDDNNNDDEEEYEDHEDEEDDLEERDHHGHPETLIEKVEKYLAQNQTKARKPRLQSDPTVADPLHTRCPGGDHPLHNASDALPNADSPDSNLDQERADYYAQLLRESTAASKSPIDDLPPERQRALRQLIEDATPLTVIVKMIGAPEPLGWGFKTTHASLRRFRDRCRKNALHAEHANIRAEAEQTIQQTGADEQTYVDATRRLLKIRLYKNAANPKGRDDELELLTRLIDRQRRTDLAERRIQLLEHTANQKEDK